MTVTIEALEKFRSLTPSEFFYRYKEIAGFTNPTKALYQTVRELVENSLDATDTHGILPKITIEIRKLDNNKVTVTVNDNGIGIPPSNIPYAFGQMLFSSKYVNRQTRGMFGLGAKMAVLYGQMTANKPVVVVSAPKGSDKVYKYVLRIDVKKNEPVVLEEGSWPKEGSWHGTRVSITLEGDWSRSRQKIIEYVKRTAIVAPYAELILITPEGDIYYYPRSTTKMPPPPKEVKPHPHGVDMELLRMLIGMTSATTLKDFLKEAFQRVGEKTAVEVLKLAGLDPNKDPKKLSDAELEKLYHALRSYKKFRPPSTEALSPIGEEIIKTGLKAVLKAEFVDAVTRKPSSFEGHPFIVEVGIAYGGELEPRDEPLLLRYANKIPLLYDEKSDVSWKVVKDEIDWSNYGVKFPAPLAVLVHIASTKIPFKGAGKESIADVPEIEREIKLGIQEVARRLKKYIHQKMKEEELKIRIVTYMKYLPEVARSLSILSIDPKTRKPEVSEELIKEKLKEIIARKLNIPKEELKDVVIGVE